MSDIFFGVLILLLDPFLRNSEKVSFLLVKTALFCQKQGYLLRSWILFEISSGNGKSPSFTLGQKHVRAVLELQF